MRCRQGRLPQPRHHRPLPQHPRDALRFEVRAFGVDVGVIESGLIRSGSAKAAAAQMDATAEGDS